METLKSEFYLYECEDATGKKQYLQHLISPSREVNHPSLTYVPEFALRGQTILDIEKMKILIQKSNPWIREKNWKLVKFLMPVELPSFAKRDWDNNYEYLPIRKKFARLTDKEKEELERYEQLLKV